MTTSVESPQEHHVPHNLAQQALAQHGLSVHGFPHFHNPGQECSCRAYSQTQVCAHVLEDRTVKASRDTPPGFRGAGRTLAVFDVDGTLLVTQGREIIVDSNGMRAAVHPLMEPVATPVTSSLMYTSDYTHAGEEDQTEDTFQLIMNACIIEPIAEKCRTFAEHEDCDVAIISARGHNPDWLARQLEMKLGLKRPLAAENVKCVYSDAFEQQFKAAKAEGEDGTSDRKALALKQLIESCQPSVIHFFDDVASNLDGACAFVASAHPEMTLHTHLVPYELSEAACAAAGVDICDLLHFQCRDEEEPNELVKSLVSLPEAKRRLSAWEMRSKERAAGRPLPP
mmetsp:Transcript_337/g.646  ORF Transcript_337/g.646 Transcript_337/m.646 type:complete len:340 (+) Transcript_337:159-1178(+)